MDIFIRPYIEADFDAVIAIWFDGWNSTGVVTVPSVTSSLLRERLPQEIAKGWVIHVAVGAEVVGFIAMEGNSLAQLFILPTFQGKGIGKRLLDFAKAQNPAGFWLTSATDNVAACRFYEREGLKRGETSIHRIFGFQLVRFDWP